MLLQEDHGPGGEGERGEVAERSYRGNYQYTWSSLVEGDEGCIDPSG